MIIEIKIFINLKDYKDLMLCLQEQKDFQPNKINILKKDSLDSNSLMSFRTRIILIYIKINRYR